MKKLNNHLINIFNKRIITAESNDVKIINKTTASVKYRDMDIEINDDVLVIKSSDFFSDIFEEYFITEEIRDCFLRNVRFALENNV